MAYKPKLIKNGCFWVVLHLHPTYGMAYNHTHRTWLGAMRCALSGVNLPCKEMR